VPGGPNNSNPFCVAHSPVNKSGHFIGNMTISFTVTFTCSNPAMSSKATFPPESTISLLILSINFLSRPRKALFFFSQSGVFCKEYKEHTDPWALRLPLGRWVVVLYRSLSSPLLRAFLSFSFSHGMRLLSASNYLSFSAFRCLSPFNWLTFSSNDFKEDAAFFAS